MSVGGIVGKISTIVLDEENGGRNRSPRAE